MTSTTTSQACPDENALSSWAVGASSAEEATSLATHVETCAPCRETFAEVVKSLRVDELAPTSVTPGRVFAPGEVALPVTVGEILLGKYQVDRVLGAGGMGVVVRARHLQLNGFVALKFIRPELVNDSDIVSRFSREARAASRLKSPYINRVLDLGVLPSGVPFMVMEYLEGETLEARVLREGKQPVGAVVSWVLQALEGLAEAHGLGIVHRDLKLANLFLQQRPGAADVLTVLDFGVAKSVNPDIEAGLQQTTMRGFIGSPGSMAPEQLTAGGVIDARADVWAMGCALYRLLTGSMPFRGADLVDLGWNIRNAPTPRLPRDLGAGLQACVDRCLAKAPADRFQDVGALQAALRNLAHEKPRRPAVKLWAAAVAMGALGAVLLTLAFSLRTVAPPPKPAIEPAPAVETARPIETAKPVEPVKTPEATSAVETKGPQKKVTPKAVAVSPARPTAVVQDAGAANSDGVFDNRL